MCSAHRRFWMLYANATKRVCIQNRVLFISLQTKCTANQIMTTLTQNTKALCLNQVLCTAPQKHVPKCLYMPINAVTKFQRLLFEGTTQLGKASIWKNAFHALSLYYEKTCRSQFKGMQHNAVPLSQQMIL